MKRIITGFVMFLVLIPAIILGGYFYYVVALFLSVVGTYELMNMFYQKNPKLKWLRFVIPGFSGLIFTTLFMATKNYDIEIFLNNGLNFSSSINYNLDEKIIFIYMLPLIIYVMGVVFSMISCIFIDDTTSQDISACITSLTYGGLLLSMAFSIEFISPVLSLGESSAHHAKCLAYVYSIAVFTDIFAYEIGTRIGKHKLCPKISPKKSIEGAIGGLVFGSILGTVLAFVLGIVPKINVLTVMIVLLLSMILSVVVQIGDLVASKLKRTYEIKDYGKIFPGHGGVMDRFDSFILAGSTFFIIAMIFRMIVFGVL